jgi:hypothetical protein
VSLVLEEISLFQTAYSLTHSNLTDPHLTITLMNRVRILCGAPSETPQGFVYLSLEIPIQPIIINSILKPPAVTFTLTVNSSRPRGLLCSTDVSESPLGTARSTGFQTQLRVRSSELSHSSG